MYGQQTFRSRFVWIVFLLIYDGAVLGDFADFVSFDNVDLDTLDVIDLKAAAQADPLNNFLSFNGPTDVPDYNDQVPYPQDDAPVEIVHPSTPTLNSCTNRSLGCPAGWYAYLDTCFVISDSPATFWRAREICAFKKSQLIKMSQDLDDFFTDSANQTPNKNSSVTTQKMWIGLHDEDKDGVFTWNDETEEPNYFNWEGSTQPNSTCVTWSLNGWEGAPCNNRYLFACSRSLNASPLSRPLKPRVSIHGEQAVAVFQPGVKKTVICRGESAVENELKWRFFFEGEVEGSHVKEVFRKLSLVRRLHSYLEYTCVEENSFEIVLNEAHSGVEFACFSEDPPNALAPCSPALKWCDFIRVYVLESKPRLPRVRRLQKGQVVEGNNLDIECWLKAKPKAKLPDYDDDDDDDDEDDARPDVLTWKLDFPFRTIQVDSYKKTDPHFRMTTKHFTNGTRSLLRIRNVTVEMNKMVVTCYGYNTSVFGDAPCQQAGVCASTDSIHVHKVAIKQAFANPSLWLARAFVITTLLVMVVVATVAYCTRPRKMSIPPGLRDSTSTVGTIQDEDLAPSSTDSSTLPGNVDGFHVKKSSKV